MFERFLQLMRGRVSVLISARDRIAVFNACHDAGIALESIRGDGEHISFFLQYADMAAFSVLAEECGFVFERRAVHGVLPLLKRIWQSRLFLIGALLFAALLLFCSNLVLSIKIAGVEEFRYIAEADIRRLAAECGIRKWAFIPMIDFDKAEDYIRLHNDYVSFAAVSRKGTQIYVEISEKTLLGDKDEPLPAGDIAAQCDAVIEEIYVLSGTALVAAGDEVKAGQILIAGTQAGEDCAAQGIIKARVRYEGRAVVPLRQEQYINTDEEAVSLYLCWDGRAQLIVAGVAEPPFEYFWSEDIKQKLFWPWGGELPCFLVSRIYHRQEVRQIELDEAEASSSASALAYAEAVAKLPIIGASVLNKELTFDKENPGEICAVVVIEASRDFGVFVPR